MLLNHVAAFLRVIRKIVQLVGLIAGTQDQAPRFIPNATILSRVETRDRGFPDGIHVSPDQGQERLALHDGRIVPKSCGIHEGWENVRELCQSLHAPAAM